MVYFYSLPLAHHLRRHSFGKVEKQELDLSRGPVLDRIEHLKQVKKKGIVNTAHLEFDFQHSRAFKT